MRNYQEKANKNGLADSITAERYGAGEYNSISKELKNLGISAGLTLADASGTGETFDQLSQATAIYGAGGASHHVDSGVVNAYILSTVGSKESPASYFDGFTVSFVPGTANTGASTVNIGGIGVKSVTDKDGNALVEGDISGPTVIKFNSSADRFEIVSSLAKLRTVNAVADLRTITGVSGDSALARGYYAPGDGGGGPLRVWKTGAPGTYVDNGNSVIVPTGGDGSGAWVWSSVPHEYDLAENPATTTGLTWGWLAGPVRSDNVITDVAAGTILLTDNATNYVEYSVILGMTVNQSAFTSGLIPIRTVVTSAGGQASSVDGRSWLSIEKTLEPNNNSLSPIFIEQFINGFGGRGMLAAEAPNVFTEQAITGALAKGATSIGVASTADLDEGGRVTIYHDSVDKYETYFVLSLTPTTVDIAPGLLYPVSTASLIERTWYNQAHPGKFYMRKLAQDIARGIEYKNAPPGDGRLYFSQFDSNPTDANDLAVAINGASIAYIDELNISQSLIGIPLESSIGRALFVTVNADGDGAYLPEFSTYGKTDSIVSAVVMCRSVTPNLFIQIRDTDGFVQAKWPIPKETQRVATKYNIPIKLPARTKKVRIEIVAESGVTGAVEVIVDQIEVYPISTTGNKTTFTADSTSTIVVLGDSWVAGDLAGSLEREPITQQLSVELPIATIVNAGVGGNKVQDLLARFDTDVVPHNPDYVVVCTGTNDSYNPASGTFFPNSVDFFEYTYNQLLSRILAIGARPVVIGVPALAESDGAFINWELNDRAKTYSRYFWKRFSAVTDPIEAQLLAWTPELKIGGSATGITYTSRSGFYERIGSTIHFTMALTLSSKGAGTGSVTIDGFPISSKTGVVVPMATTAYAVSGATAIQAILNISAANTMRLQIPTATTSVAATEANITNTTTFYIAGSYPAFDA